MNNVQGKSLFLSILFAASSFMLISLILPTETVSEELDKQAYKVAQLDPAEEQLDQVSEPIGELSEPNEDVPPEPLGEDSESIGEASERVGSEVVNPETLGEVSRPDDQISENIGEVSEPIGEASENLPIAPEGDGSDMEYDTNEAEMPLGDREAEGRGIGGDDY